MIRLHVQRLESGVLIAPASDPLVRLFLEQWVPRQYWRPLYRSDAVLIDPILADLGIYLPIATYGINARCVECWEGRPCSERLKYAQGEAMPRHKEPIHGVRTHDALGRRCLLVYDPSRRMGGTMNAYAPFEHHYDGELRAWYVDAAAVGSVTRAFKRLSPWCGMCVTGQRCTAWKAIVQPKPISNDAARILGIRLPASEKSIQDAFRKMALRFHPDHGGTNDEMKRLIEARDKLLR